MAGTTKLMTAGGGGVSITPASSIASDVTVQVPASNGTIITTATNDKSIPKSALPAGSVLQVVQAVKTDTQTVNTSTFTDITGLSVSITPSSSSNKILVMATVNAGGGSDVYMNIDRSGTAIIQGTGATSKNCTAFVGNNSYGAQALVVNYLDSPATTSTLTYKIQLGAFSGYTAKVNRRGADDNFSATSMITVMEIAA